MQVMHMRVNNTSLQYTIMSSEVISPAEEPVGYERQTFLDRHNMKSNVRKRKEDKRDTIIALSLSKSVAFLQLEYGL